MAVFPDRIVLKNSTDSQAAIEAAIQTGGTDEITQGEVVLGINPTSVQLYAKAGDGSIVTLGGTSISTLGDLTDVDLSTSATDGQVIAYNTVSGNWEPVDQSGGGGSASLGRGDGGDLDFGTVDSAFVFAVYGGGDLDATNEDKPIELVSYDIDGGELT